MTPSFQNRQSCPPGACICGREGLLDNPAADLRFLRLTRPEEKRLLERLENLRDLDDLHQAADLVLGVINRHPPEHQGHIYTALMCYMHDITVVGRYLKVEEGR